MNWKRYKALSDEEKREDIYYIIGLDIGNDSSGIAFYNAAEEEPETIDLSGGYGRPAIPTAMQYIVESKEWVFGEYAILNRGMGKEVTLNDMVERLGDSEYIDVDNKPVRLTGLLGLYIKELMSNVKNINPKAEIAGIVVSVPSYFSGRAREELKRAFKSAGYEKELIALVSDRECIFAYHYRGRVKLKEKSLIVDYGAREVRGGVYIAEEKYLRSLSSLFESDIGTRMIEEQAKELFTDYYTINNPIQARQGLDKNVQDQLMAFTYQHKDILFQKAIRNKPAKLYYNFAFPPFEQTVKAEEADKLIEPFRKKFDQFIRKVLEKNLVEKVKIADIDVVICVGGGFEMLWAKEAMESLFPQGKLHMYKNSKAVTAMGAAVYAAQLLEMCPGAAVAVEDRHQLSVDIGLAVEGGRFIPLAECNSFWWQPHPARVFIVNAPVTGEVPFSIMSRTPEGELKVLSDMPLSGLPERPKGTTKLSVHLKFLSDSEATAQVSDCGFGEMFPKTEYKQEISVALKV